MKLLVKLFRDTPNLKKAPEDWPAICKEVDDDHKVLAPWIEMTVKEYQDYRRARQASYDSWEAGTWIPHVKKLKQLNKAAEAEKRRLKTLEDLEVAQEATPAEIKKAKEKLARIESQIEQNKYPEA